MASAAAPVAAAVGAVGAGEAAATGAGAFFAAAGLGDWACVAAAGISATALINNRTSGGTIIFLGLDRVSGVVIGLDVENKTKAHPIHMTNPAVIIQFVRQNLIWGKECEHPLDAVVQPGQKTAALWRGAGSWAASGVTVIILFKLTIGFTQQDGAVQLDEMYLALALENPYNYNHHENVTAMWITRQDLSRMSHDDLYALWCDMTKGGGIKKSWGMTSSYQRAVARQYGWVDHVCARPEQGSVYDLVNQGPGRDWGIFGKENTTHYMRPCQVGLQTTVRAADVNWVVHCHLTCNESHQMKPSLSVNVERAP